MLANWYTVYVVAADLAENSEQNYSKIQMLHVYFAYAQYGSLACIDQMILPYLKMVKYTITSSGVVFKRQQLKAGHQQKMEYSVEQ